MTTYEINTKFIEKKYPELLNVLDNMDQDPHYIQCETKSNEHNLKIMIREKEYYLHSRYNADSEARRWLETIEHQITDEKIIVLFGMGLGSFLNVLINHSKANHIVIYEPDQVIFNNMLRMRDVTKLLSSHKIKTIAIGNHEIVRAQVANGVASSLIKDMTIVSPPIYEQLYSDVLIDLKNSIKVSFANQISNFHTQQHFQNTWLENILYNLPYTIEFPSCSSLRDSYSGATAVIVGSGPSLKHDIEHLRTIESKCIIIAAGSSLQALQFHGIRPDLLVSIDGGIPNLNVFKNVDTSQVPLLFVPQINYQILDIYKNNLSYAIFGDELSQFIYGNSDVPVFKSTTSVTGTAIQVAIFMGANRIVLMGQDLSYPGNQFYSPGISHIEKEKMDSILRSATLRVENVDGGENPTTENMYTTLKDMELLIKLCALEGTEFINTSKGGAAIEGAAFKDIREVVSQLQTIDAINKEIQVKGVSLEEKIEGYNRLIRIIKDLSDLNVQMEKQLVKLLNVLEELANSKSAKKLNRNLNLVNQLWQQITLNDVFKTFYAFSLEHYINVYKRHIPQIVEANNLALKAELIVNHLGTLIRQLLHFNPNLKLLLEKSNQRIEQFGSKGGYLIGN